MLKVTLLPNCVNKILKIKSLYLLNAQRDLTITSISMAKRQINRLKVVLAEEGRTNKWLAEQLEKNTATVSRWCTNEMQPSLETLVEIAETLDVDVRELLNQTK